MSMTQAEYDQARADHEILTITCTNCGHDHVIQLNCGDRTCEVCRRKWYGYHYRALKKIISGWENIRKIEVTLKNIPDDHFNKNTIKYLRKCFNRLLHRKKYRKAIKGGFYFVHVTNKGEGWHPHLHIIYTGEKIYPKDLSRDWRSITGNSYIVWSKFKVSPHRALKYLLGDLLSEPKILDQFKDCYNEVMKGSRIVQGFGEYARVSIRSPFICPICGSDTWIVRDFEISRLHREGYDDTS